MPQGGDSQRGRRVPKPRPKRLTTEAAKDKFVELMQDGVLILPALEKIGYARKTYEGWRKNDPNFKTRVDTARQLRKPDRGVVRGERIGFAEFRRKYLNTETFWHQLQWVDMLEGREPRDLHEAETFSQGKRNRILINVPPFHAKSMTITVDYSVYRLCMDPSFRILIVSAGSTLAQDFLYAIKQRLSSPDFIDLQKAYAPDGGWEATSESWTESRIVFGTDVRTAGTKGTFEKDPNVQTVGMRSKIYGKRADLIILDDAVDGTNVSEHKKQLTWLRREVLSRLEAKGKCLVLGTRIASVDLYSELMKADNYANGKVPWTHLAAPAILEEAEDPKDHVTLWPHSDRPWVENAEDADECLCENPSCSVGYEVDGKTMYPRWDGTHLEAGPRAENNNAEWALVYQQKSVPEDATFPEHAVLASMNKQRLCGLLEENKLGHPIRGMDGKYVIAGLDPAVSGNAGFVVIACDREGDKRYLLNAWNVKAPTEGELRDRIQSITTHYGVHEWRVEKTGLLKMFTQNRELRAWLQTRGVRFTPHETNANKWDVAYGISSLGSLFGQYDRSWDTPNGDWKVVIPPLIELPRANQAGVVTLVHQLVTWTPDLDPAKVPQDVLMALWFAEIGAREYLGVGRSGNVVAFGRSNKFVSPRSQKNRMTVNLADYRTGNA